MLTRPFTQWRKTTTGAPVMSSSSTASLTDSRSSMVVDSAMMTGLKAGTSSPASLSGGGAALQPALVAAQALLDAQRGLVGARIGVRRHAVGVQRDAGIEMDGAFGAEAEAFLADRHVARIAAVEIFFHGLGDAGIHAVAQGLAAVENDNRYADRTQR